MSGRIRVLVADDDDLLRGSLCELVASDESLVLVGEARDGAEAVSAVHRLSPDVVLMDVRMPVLDGLEATRAVCAAPGAVRVVVLTTFDLDEYVYEALRAGASGFLLKIAGAQEILRAIHTVHSGHSLLAPEVTGRVIAEFARRHERTRPGLARFAELTDREHDVVAAVVAGMSNDEIAAALFLSRATVKTYLSRLFDKLEVRDRTQLVILAYESGFADTLRR
ncbi:DNA-binding response regulator, NarL/FixJ family, contains REC and HTH domains [Lentzea fradiae]|uniref:DNA-binding response regulator, NarL/FixJ family, contains REC and HTH domains n=1 Tax=Lentzea fradiae TaxID=200378 RepID=A0A1G7W1G8_9PSEU|nr:response regulator transcription factor [Lentzea fradiae]SDG65708.1 DNA-binding response regulator, NarL/FixJ family, contains REC and HTH domains [Lentzea fradiae]